MGGIIGVGIFYTPHAVAQSVPSSGAFLAMWAIGGLIALNGALTFAELGATFPKAGGWYVFLREGFGPFMAYLFAWVVLCVISDRRDRRDGPRVRRQSAADADCDGLAVGAATICVATGVALRGAKTGATVQNLCMLVKLSAIAAMAVVGLLVASPAPAAAALDGSCGRRPGRSCGGHDPRRAAGPVRLRRLADAVLRRAAGAGPAADAPARDRRRDSRGRPDLPRDSTPPTSACSASKAWPRTRNSPARWRAGP